MAISTDDVAELASWAEEADFPFVFGSDPGSEVGRLYGAWLPLEGGGSIDNRTLFVVDSQGVIRYVAAPFRENDPVAYEELAKAIERISAGLPF